MTADEKSLKVQPVRNSQLQGETENFVSVDELFGNQDEEMTRTTSNVSNNHSQSVDNVDSSPMFSSTPSNRDTWSSCRSNVVESLTRREILEQLVRLVTLCEKTDQRLANMDHRFTLLENVCRMQSQLLRQFIAGGANCGATNSTLNESITPGGMLKFAQNTFF